MEETIRQKLPNTDSIEELAEFWDSHDLTDFAEELEEVQPSPFERGAQIPLTLRVDEAKAVHELAEAKGVAEDDLKTFVGLESSIPDNLDRHGFAGFARVGLVLAGTVADRPAASVSAPAIPSPGSLPITSGA